MTEDRTLEQQWIRDRIKAVSERYSAYDALVESDIEVDDRDFTSQIRCPLPGHGPDNTPSARYYAADGSGPPHFYCFKCKERLDGIELLARLRGTEFMRALSDLERRFGIRVPKRPEAPDIAVPADKSSSYESRAWEDVPRMMAMLESQLIRIRSFVPMLDFVRWCRLLDAVRWDLDRNGGKPLPQMPIALSKLRDAMRKACRDANL